MSCKKFTLEQPTKAQTGSRRLALLFLQLLAPDEGGLSTPRPGCFTSGKDPIPIVLEAGWSPEPVWTGAEKLSPTGTRSPDLPARSQSLYRLCYSGHRDLVNKYKTHVLNFCNFMYLLAPYMSIALKNLRKNRTYFHKARHIHAQWFL